MYVTMGDNNCNRSHIAMRLVYAFVEYVFFIPTRGNLFLPDRLLV
jgi:hypothetical protein